LSTRSREAGFAGLAALVDPSEGHTGETGFPP
jgi:hypothetical protein